MIMIIAAALAATQSPVASAQPPAQTQHAQHQQQGHQQHGDMAKMMEHCKAMMNKMHSEHAKPGEQAHQEHGRR